MMARRALFLVKKGFTLIELLIVVAIIAILAAIAVPNFMEAQARSKVSRAKADMRSLATGIESYLVDHGVLFWDNNDPGRPSWYPANFEVENGVKTDAKPNQYDLRSLTFRIYAAWSPITTPIAYVTSIPLDSFSEVMPYSYETWWDYENSKPYYCLITSMGPDRDMDSGYGGVNAVYDPTNGTVSGGDIYRLAGVSNPDMVKYYFGEDFDFNP